MRSKFIIADSTGKRMMRHWFICVVGVVLLTFGYLYLLSRMNSADERMYQYCQHANTTQEVDDCIYQIRE